ncbi:MULTISPECIES: uroporphyrinogen-III synthase [unclassified Pseudarthrobacter]|uniref:uroporphyrinogen-III synthase n=1 Tax=unclassified Pseudarthrobacter TaxID=2647000 RepID=UPI003077B306
MAGQDKSSQQDLQPLAHARVLITRSPERSPTLVAALEKAGAEALLLPLIDFERAADQHSLDVACDALAAGAFDWLVVSSATTVHVLRDKAAERGLTLRDWLPATTKVAAIGQASKGMLESAGVPVALTPAAAQSAAGLLDVWPAGAGRVLLPQADIAAPRLAEGLRSSGASVTVVIAYQTVDFPADAERRLAVDPLAADPGKNSTAARVAVPPSYSMLTTEAARTQIAAGRLHAVVAASPSAVRRIRAALSPLRDCRLVAIGRSTADEASALGLDVAAVAAEPTPAGLVAAVCEALDSPTQPGPPVEDTR